MDEQEKLVRLMQEGDIEAFDRIFELYQSRLLRTAYLITGNHADSEDIVQETFVKCYCNCKSLRDPAGFTTWIYQIMTRTAWRYGRRKRREEPVEKIYDRAEPATDDLPLNKVLENEQKEELYDRIRKLNQKQRTVIILYYFNQMSTREISRVLGCMEGTVKSRLYTARKILGNGIREEQMEYGQTEI